MKTLHPLILLAFTLLTAHAQRYDGPTPSQVANYRPNTNPMPPALIYVSNQIARVQGQINTLYRQREPYEQLRRAHYSNGAVNGSLHERYMAEDRAFNARVRVYEKEIANLRLQQARLCAFYKRPTPEEEAQLKDRAARLAATLARKTNGAPAAPTIIIRERPWTDYNGAHSALR